MISKKRKNTAGFTLVELVIAFGISALVLVILTRLLSMSLFSCSLQDQLAEMNQNARFTVRELGDILSQAGADLQIMTIASLDKDTIIVPEGNTAQCTGFTVKINPRGGIYEFPRSITSAICTLKVEDASKFRYADKVARIPGIRSTLPVKIYELKEVNENANYIVFKPDDSFFMGDALCAFIKTRYFLNGTDLCIDDTSNVIAENIDSLSIVFLDKDGNPTAVWVNMRSAELLVRTKTAQPDNRYNGYADHCRRVTLTYNFRLRNKIEN